MMTDKFIRCVSWFLLPLMTFSSLVSAAPGDEGGLPAGRNNMPDFNVTDLIKTSIKGTFDESCGGYCIVGACAHLRIRVTWSGVRMYTIISPKVRHSNADFLAMSYNHVGQEPWREWRESFGLAMRTVNEGLIGSTIIPPFGLQGGRADPLQQDAHQSVSYKETDIIGHPASLLPQILDTRGRIRPRSFNYQVPTIGGFPDVNDARAADDPDDEWDIEAMFDAGLAQILETIEAQIRAALMAIEIINIIATIADMVDTIRDLIDFYNTAMQTLEAFVRGSFYGNFINPRFQANRLFCPASIVPLQPYYLSFADSFFWRSGFPITDGPISGSNHTAQVMNPFSNPVLGSGLETWGQLYPREGTLDQSHDSKTASVLAWRAFDVLRNDVRAGGGGHRVGVPMPNGYRNKDYRWQMIYPELKTCQRTPYYPTTDLTLDFMQPAEFGGYAWNIYTQYECCMNTSGRKVGEIDLPQPICLSLSI